MHEGGSRGRELSQGFLRQRRNLLLVSIVMPVFFLSEASINKINLLGTEVFVDNPLVVKVSFLVLAIYFLWRYYQYRGEEKHSEEFNSDCKAEVFGREFKYFSDALKKKAGCFEFDNFCCSFAGLEDPPEFVEGRLPKLSLDKKSNWFFGLRKMEIYGINKKYENLDEKQHEISESKRKLILRNWAPVEKKPSDNRGGLVFVSEVRYSFLKVVFIRLYSVFVFLFKRPHFTDYQLPFWFGVSSILVSATYFLTG